MTAALSHSGQAVRAEAIDVRGCHSDFHPKTTAYPASVGFRHWISIAGHEDRSHQRQLRSDRLIAVLCVISACLKQLASRLPL